MMTLSFPIRALTTSMTSVAGIGANAVAIRNQTFDDRKSGHQLALRKRIETEGPLMSVDHVFEKVAFLIAGYRVPAGENLPREATLQAGNQQILTAAPFKLGLGLYESGKWRNG